MKKTRRFSDYKKENAFTLMEIIVVCVIVSVLASVSIVSYKKVIMASDIKRLKTDLIALYGAEQICNTRTGLYRFYVCSEAEVSNACIEALYSDLGINITLNDKVTYVGTTGAYRFIMKDEPLCEGDLTPHLPLSNTNPAISANCPYADFF